MGPAPRPAQRRRPTLHGIVGYLLVPLLTLVVTLSACGEAQPNSGVRSDTPRTTPSPLVFGTNMALYNQHDQIVLNPATQQLLRQANVAIIRMPFRSSLPDSVETQALQAIKNIGAVPLVIVHGAADPNALAEDTHLIELTQSVFGASTVYVEFGNEPDLDGIDVAQYTATWNQVVPRLKALAPTYKFIGPVTSTYNPDYVATFNKGAVPRPDFNSWHEYTCGLQDSDSYCLSHISNWTRHVEETNSAVKRAIGSTIPFMITEWNMSPEQDPRYRDSAFMARWTDQAIRTLVANVPRGLVAAMQYCATNNEAFNLINGFNQPTAQGQAFFQAIAAEQAASPSATPSGPPNPTPSATPTNPRSPVTLFSFTDGSVHGWASSGAPITAVDTSPTPVTGGEEALRVQFGGLTRTTYPYVAAPVKLMPAIGQPLLFSLYAPPQNAPINAPIQVRPFAVTAGQEWLGSASYASLRPGWNEIALIVAPGTPKEVVQIGLQFMAGSDVTVDGSIYLRDVRLMPAEP